MRDEYGLQLNVCPGTHTICNESDYLLIWVVLQSLSEVFYIKSVVQRRVEVEKRGALLGRFAEVPDHASSPRMQLVLAHH
eukprot:CAMPEP_0182800602 /NCGR_PEP_ID=MMETSP0006_2-20121128/2500_1 /TAXON_ID=97485 /ORGANISM="Prymnesium parvum, Strain Texoma1" /LENGTH=79 /DNA_ID=CAMNT_0024925855 /DNA_START=218 /DNA_END=457 /DNA_ORIENTATION=+